MCARNFTRKNPYVRDAKLRRGTEIEPVRAFRDKSRLSKLAAAVMLAGMLPYRLHP